MNEMINVDARMLAWIQDHMACGFLDLVMPWITKLGDGGVLWIIGGTVMLFFTKTRRMGMAVLLSLLIGLLVCNLTLKLLVARTRPFEVYGYAHLLIAPPSDFSFPSGHTLAAFEAATCVFIKYKKWGCFAYVLAILIAFSRLYLYVHYPSDVAFSIILGIGIALLSTKIVTLCTQKHRL